tara:strand:- start:36 stop:377 length:342 start_codon:yes stop_codon:yes gene_type:complete
MVPDAPNNKDIIEFQGTGNTLHCRARFGNKRRNLPRKLLTIQDHEIPWAQRHGPKSFLYKHTMTEDESPLKNVYRDGTKAIGLPNGTWATKKINDPDKLKKLRSEFNYHMNER